MSSAREEGREARIVSMYKFDTEADEERAMEVGRIAFNQGASESAARVVELQDQMETMEQEMIATRESNAENFGRAEKAERETVKAIVAYCKARGWHHGTELADEIEAEFGGSGTGGK